MKLALEEIRPFSVMVASPEVPVRMLNGGISSSAIFIAGQLSPHARLTPTSMRRAVVSAASCGEGGTMAASGKGGGRGEGTAGLWSTVPARAQAGRAVDQAVMASHSAAFTPELRALA